jgi:bacitracin transport system permease protein
MLFVEILKEKSNQPDIKVTYYTIFSHSNYYMIIIFGLMVYTVFAAYIYSREYSENTLKMILTIPMSKSSLLICKFLVLTIWCVLLSMLSWFFCLIVGGICGASEISAMILAKSLLESIYGTVLLLFTLTPIIFLSIWTKGIVVPVITSSAILMLNAALSNESWAALFPWSSCYLLIVGRLEQTGYPLSLIVSIILVTSIMGIALSFWYFNKNDVK